MLCTAHNPANSQGIRAVVSRAGPIPVDYLPGFQLSTISVAGPAADSNAKQKGNSNTRQKGDSNAQKKKRFQR